MESGVFQKYEHDQERTASQYKTENLREEVPFSKVVPLLIILSFGLFSSMFVLICEIFISKFKSRGE